MGRVPTRGLQSKHSAAVLAKYEAYLKDKTIAKQSHPLKNRPKSEKLVLTPFTVGLPAKTFAEASAFVTVVTDNKAKINTGATRIRSKSDLATGEISLKLGKFRAARVVIRTGRAQEGADATSKTSGLPYKYYGGTSRSIPFGRGADGETEKTAFDAIKKVIAPEGGENTALVTHLPEKSTD